jgi:hypothetical protein
MTDLSEDTEALFESLQTDVNNNASIINNTITEASENLGVTLTNSFKDILNDENLISQVQSKDYTEWLDNETGVNKAINDIQSQNATMLEKNGEYAQALIEAINSAANAFSTNTGTQAIPSSSGTVEYNSASSSSGTSSSSSSSGTKSSSSSSTKNITVTKAGKAAIVTDNGDTIATQLYTAGGETFSHRNCTSAGVSISNNKISQDDLAKIVADRDSRKQKAAATGKNNANGYKTGLHYANKDEWAWTSEDGAEAWYDKSTGAIYTPIGIGDKVYTAEMAENLWQLAKGNIVSVGEGIKPALLQTSTTSNTSGDFNMNGFTINVTGVDNPEQFASKFVDILQNDTTVQKALRSSTVDLLAGKSKFAVNKY